MICLIVSHNLYAMAYVCANFVINVAGNRMRGEIPSELGNLESLKNLDIRKCAGCCLAK